MAFGEFELGAAAGKDGDPARARPVSVAVCAITRDRPEGLQRLLASFAALKRVADAGLFFVIVENSGEKQTAAAVEAFERSVSEPVTFALQPEAGIPLARNAAVRLALAGGADFILFADDDEEVEAGWLEEMLREQRRTGAFLIGGPVKLAPLRGEHGFMHRLVHKGVRDRFRRVARRSRLRSSDKQAGSTIVTSNWMADARLFREAGLWFDEALRFTGGSDTAFDRSVRAGGFKTGWASQAKVRETLPPERLTLGYQYMRGREQSKASLSAKLKVGPRGRVIAMAVLSTLIRIPGLVALLPLCLVRPGYGLVSLARNLGWITGRIGALLGQQSKLYLPSVAF